MRRIVIVGASVAGTTAAETLRDEGFAGTIALINGEAHPGYDRPPLSKHVLSGRMQRADLALKPADFYRSHDIDHRLSARAEHLDLDTRAVVLESGERIPFDGLIIATGLRPKPLAGQPRLRGMHMLRTIDDAEALRAELLHARHVVVIGAGFLGSEVAATASGLGAHATIVDPLELPMLRQLGPDVASAVLRTHRERGVHVRAGRFVAAFEHEDGRVSGVTLDDGERLEAGVVVVAVGSMPDTGWLHDSGLPIDDGVVCDAYCRAADRVYAAGDVARWRDPRSGVSRRVEHRLHAAEHAMVAARNLLGAAVPFDPLPYFWTDFHDVKVQVFGRIGMHDAMTVTRGELGARSFTAVYAHAGVITAVLGWNAARDVRRMSALVGQSTHTMNSVAAVAA